MLDTETTGLRPGPNRIIEIAVARYYNGTIGDSFETLVCPPRQLPSFITGFTGITKDMVYTAPSMTDIFPSMQRFKLEQVASVLHVPITSQHRAVDDVHTTTAIFTCCLLLFNTGYPKGEKDIIAPRAQRYFRQSVATISQGKIPTGKLLLYSEWCATFPESPGIYFMRDKAGTLLYIGKAKNMRARLFSYYHHHLGTRHRTDKLLQSLHSIEPHVLGSELEALLTESRLIKESQPI
jgi:predicted GIY-YIG superfamily endonuclease